MLSLAILRRGHLKYWRTIAKPVPNLSVLERVGIHHAQVLYKGASDVNDEPVKFSQSKAKDHVTFVKKSKSHPPTAISLLISMTVFLLYFCVLREENDLDEKIEAMFSLEELDLLRAIEYAKVAGRDTTELEKRLDELRKNRISTN